jgi:DNA invertase Pin-like site-specific DNA recombinase
MKAAFSYIHLSSPDQAKSAGCRRLCERAEAWARTNGYVFVKGGAELGVSYYRQRASHGAFGEFLRAAKAGDLPKGTVLLVETLEKDSGQTPRHALARFLDLINMGIGVVTLTDGELHTADSLEGSLSGMKLFGSLMVMVYADRVSRIRSERSAAAWQRRRLVAETK